MSAIAFLAGLGAGHLDEVDKQRRNARQDKLDAQQDEQYQFQKSERDRAVADRAALRAAAAPVQVVPEGGLPDTMDNRDVGLPGEAAVAAPSFRVGANTFASQGVAAQAATAQRQQNIGAALDTQDPAGAGGRELQVLNLTAAKRDAANKLWDDHVNAARASANPADAFAQLMSESHADGQGGAFKAKAVYSPDGKTFTIAQLNPDGSTTPTKMPHLPNDEGGWNALQLQMSKAIPLTAKLAHYQQVTEGERKAKHDDASLAIQQQNADSLEQQRKDAARHTSAMEGFESRRLGMESARFGLAKAAADAENKLPPAVKQQFASYDKELNTIGSAIAKAQAEGSFDQASPSAQSLLLRQRELMAKSERLLTPFMGDKVPGKPADDLGLFKDGAKPAAAAKPAGAPAVVAAPKRFAEPAAVDSIPAPPPPTRQVGINTQPNPAYEEWRQKFGDAWEAQRAAEEAASSAAAAAAKSRFNPYTQNGVR